MSTARERKGGKGGWGVPVALVALGAPPLVAGALRLVTLAGVAEIMPVSEARTGMPLPVAVHIVSAAVFAVLGALQFAAGFRRRRPAWHRAAGRLVVAGGLLAGLSGLWLALFYPRGQNVGDLLTAFRLLFGSAMVAATVLGFVTIRRGDVRRHRAWMTRAYALGLGAGTQMLTGLVASFIVSPPTELSRALQDGAGWAINLAVAEWVNRRRLAPPVPFRIASAPSVAAGTRPAYAASRIAGGFQPFLEALRGHKVHEVVITAGQVAQAPCRNYGPLGQTLWPETPAARSSLVFDDGRTITSRKMPVASSRTLSASSQ